MIKWVESRLRVGGWARKGLNKIFPDHWSFLLGEISLFTFVILVATGIFLTLFYRPDATPVIYDGPYLPLKGQEVSAAYESVMRLSFEVRAGLVMRQIHHWTAIVFVAAVVVHMLRVFFTGAFRRPRELNWLIGVGLLIFAIGMGFTGYSLPDDLLSGNGLRIAYSVMLSIPFAGPYLASLIFGGEFPAEAIISRLFVMHIMLLPALIIGLISVHLAILVRQKHAQFRGPGRTERNVVGKPLWPSQTFKSLALLFLTASVMAFMGGLLQINPVWNYGPFKPYITSAPSQPDWYVGWLDGGLRLFPGWDINLFGITIAAPFIPGVLVPGLLFTFLALWPFLEARWTGDRAEHQLLDHPRDMPLRTAIGAAGIVFFTVLTLEGGGDVLSITFDIPVEAITNFFRVALFVLPAAAGMLTYRICENLQGTDIHPFRRARGVRLRRTREGGFEEV